MLRSSSAVNLICANNFAATFESFRRLSKLFRFQILKDLNQLICAAFPMQSDDSLLSSDGDESYDYTTEDDDGPMSFELSSIYQPDSDPGGQQVTINQYAQSIVDFSSQYGSDTSISYTAYNVAGKPSKYPDYGDFPETFAFRSYGPWWHEASSARDEFATQNFDRRCVVDDFLLARFEDQVYPDKIKVFETYNPGAIVRIWAYLTTTKRWLCLWDACESPPQPFEPNKARCFSPDLKPCPSPTRYIRLEFNQRGLAYFTQIDAIMLTGRKCVPSSTENSAGQDPNNVIFESIETLSSDDETIEEIELTLDKLPYESIFKILSFLDWVSLYRCGAVCRRFQQIVANDPLLYTEINLRPYWNCASDSLLSSLSKRCALIKKLDLSWCGTLKLISFGAFKDFITEHGKKLTHLRLDTCKFITNGFCLETIGTYCGQNLRELTLQNYIPEEEDFTGLHTFTNLERLDLSRTTIKQESLMIVLANNANLRHLNLSLCSIDVNLDEVAVQIAKHNPKLVSLDLWKSHQLTSHGLTALSQCTLLEEIELGWCLRQEPSPGESLRLLVKSCPRLKKLFLAASRGLNDRDLLEIAHRCPNLEQLDVMGSVFISTEMCYRVLCSCTKLKMLDLSFCDNLDSTQVALWQVCFDVNIKRSRTNFRPNQWGLPD
ncbi:F-box/LRR-repeat protein 4 [Toxorhynchites rutilus septentrionalis]|uniref:F-box/LRR-repeat protein 4 n=1 Tax=Toxorhynchites rutilus septentrionalis TaxID=329112 RepID=UPI00247B1FDA|nr:F-box/LRR-repeat protein 4 [Toxorhynchites rutilus septentrionalis]